jgi:hypothetical protein
MRMISILLGAEFDGNVRGGADHARTSIGIAVASERLEEQKEFLGQHRRRLRKKIASFDASGQAAGNSIN